MAVATKKKRKLKLAIGSVLSATDACTTLQQSPSCTSTLRRVLKTLSVGGREAESFAEDLLANGFLCLIPPILRHSSRKGVATGVEVLGALSMSSLAAHRKVVSDKNAICALAEILKRTDVELVTAACHASVDLLITPFGCESLKESGVFNHLLHLLCWIGDLSQEDQKRVVNMGHPSAPWAAGETDLNPRESGKPFEQLLPSKLSNDIQSTSGERKPVTFAEQKPALCEEFEELVIAASTAISALIRNLGIENSSQELSRNALNFLRSVWHTLLRKDQILLNSTAADDEPKWTCNRGTRQLIAKCVVQLAMEVGSNWRKLSIQQGLFEKTDFSQTLFFENYWEQTPVVLGRALPSCLSALSQKFNTLAAVVNNFLAWTVSCPRAVADQLDSLHLRESIEGDVGEPMIYGQDIRIVKTVPPEPYRVSPLTPTTDRPVKMHYNGHGAASDSQAPKYVHPREILEAVESGYSVAIKGMELRCSSIADIADCLARQCGQPSVGVNLYMTPPNAQGLDLHYDDHCVFICQLVGRKIWSVFPPQNLIPRLYACRTLNLGALNDLAPTVYNLEKGDVFYIPRGFPHKAHCKQQEGVLNDGLRFHSLEENTAMENPGSFRDAAGEDRNLMNNFLPGMYSLHLTFGVEVEPPFEWEGLVHIALRLWTKQRWQMQAISRQNDSDATGESYNRYEQFCEGLLHIAINLLGEKEVVLRKACMIAAEVMCAHHSRPSLNEEVIASPKVGSKVFVCEQGKSLACRVCDPVSVEYFQELLEVVAHKADYKEAYAFAEGLSGECTGSCTSGMEWLRHVPDPGGCSPTSSSDPVALVMRNIQSKQYNEDMKSEVEVAFSNMKAEFGKALLFHQASKAFRSVHRQYRIMRKKFTDGMLALHDNC